MPRSKTKVPTIEEYQNWRSNLSYLDRTNFDTLLQLPSCMSILHKMGDCEYRRMALFALALALVLAKKEKNAKST